MKKIVEVSSEGFGSLLGEQVVVYACRYIYTGKLVGVNNTCILLEGAKFVYSTGENTKGHKGWESAEDCWNTDWYIQIASIESFGKSPI